MIKKLLVAALLAPSLAQANTPSIPETEIFPNVVFYGCEVTFDSKILDTHYNWGVPIAGVLYEFNDTKLTFKVRYHNMASRADGKTTFDIATYYKFKESFLLRRKICTYSPFA